MTRRLLQPLVMDVRSLAAFRIGVVAMLLADLAQRARDLGAHHTDAGMVTRSDAVVNVPCLHEWHHQFFKNVVYGKRGDRPLLPYGRHVCRIWNARHEDADGYERHVTWRHWCFR